jgi:ATP-dependent Lon protease
MKKGKRKRKSLSELLHKKKVRFTKDGYLDDGFVIDNDTENNKKRKRINIDMSDDGSDDSDVEFDPIDNVTGDNYFECDSKPIQKDIIKRLSESNIDINPSELEDVVSRAFSGTSQCFLQDYMGCKPSNDMWKLGMSQKDVKELEPELELIRREIEDEVPTIPKILQSNTTREDKKRCIKLYDQLKNTEPYTTEYETIIEKINNIIRKGKQYTKKEIQELERIESKLKLQVTAPDNLKNRILKLDADEKTKAIIYSLYLEMLEHEPGSQAYNTIREEVEWSVKIPHKTTQDFSNMTELSSEELNKFYCDFLDRMDKELYGMHEVKMKMLHILNDRRMGRNGANIALVGLPGTGKTHVGKAFAKCLDMPFEKISVGGMDDASILKGSNRVWNGSAPSIILQILSRMKSSNGVIMFDELDKLRSDKAKEIQFALLHISDYVHNDEFCDNYLNKFPHDFSKIFFIYNMNTTDTLDPALLSRLDITEVKPYTKKEKMDIIRDYTLPRTLDEVGMDRSDVIMDKRAMEKLIALTDAVDGMRSIEKHIKSIVSKINMYRSITLSDGSRGDMEDKLPYIISNYKLPLKITTKLLLELI